MIIKLISSPQTCHAKIIHTSTLNGKWVLLLEGVCLSKSYSWYLITIILGGMLIRQSRVILNYNFQTHFTEYSSTCILDTLCSQVNVTEPHQREVNFGSGNGFLPSDNKQLPEPMLTHISILPNDVTWQQ